MKSDGRRRGGPKRIGSISKGTWTGSPAETTLGITIVTMTVAAADGMTGDRAGATTTGTTMGGMKSGRSTMITASRGTRMTGHTAFATGK